LLANRIYQPPSMCLNQRIRQQAGSLYLDFVFSEGKVLD